MILFSDSPKLLEIVQKAIEYMMSKGYKQDFYIKSISWNDDEFYWVVRFYCERGSFDEECVLIEPLFGSYIAREFVRT